MWLQRPRLPQHLFICLALFILAGGLDIYRLGTSGLWFDEMLSVNRARQTLPVLWQIVTMTQPNMALYYFVLHFWIRVTALAGWPATEALVRLPSAFCAALGALVFYGLARRFFHVTVACCAALLYIFNALQLTYAQEARSYALQLLLLSLSWYALCVLFSSRPTRRAACWWWICFVSTSALAVYAQLFSEFILTAQAVAIALLALLPNLWRERVREQIRPLLMSWLAIGLLLVPILYASRVGAKTAWLPIPTPADVYHVLLDMSGQNRLLLALCLLLLLYGLGLLALAAVPQGQRWLFAGDEQSGQDWQKRCLCLLPLALLLLSWFLVPFLLSYLISQTDLRLFSARYLVVVMPAYLLLVAQGLALLHRPTLRLVLGALLVFLNVISLPTYYQQAQVEDWRTGTSWMQIHSQPGDGWICFDNAQGCALGIQYYLQTYPRGYLPLDPNSPGYFPWVTYDTTNHLGPFLEALDTRAIQTYGTKHPRLFFCLGRVSSRGQEVQAMLRWLNAHYRLLAQEHTPTLTIYLYVTGARP
jgi:uncharacterized membrane protein